METNCPPNCPLCLEEELLTEEDMESLNDDTEESEPDENEEEFKN